MKRKPKAPRLVTVAIFTTITIVFWIFFSLYNILVQPAQLDLDENLLKPIDPTLDTKALNSISSREFYEEGEVEIPIFIIQITPSPTIAPTPTPEELQTETETPPPATSEATLNETEI